MVAQLIANNKPHSYSRDYSSLQRVHLLFKLSFKWIW